MPLLYPFLPITFTAVSPSHISTRGTRSRSPSPPVPQTAPIAADGVSHSVQGENDICSPPHVRASPIGRSPPARGRRSGGRRRRRETHSAVVPRPRVEYERTQLQEESRRFVDDGDNQRQHRPAVAAGERFGSMTDTTNGSCHRHRVPAMDKTPITFGSERYFEKRRLRAARGEEAVRQLGQELDKIAAL